MITRITKENRAKYVKLFAKATEALKASNISVVMLTGDNYETAHTIAEEVGIDEVISDVLPTDKQEVIRNKIKETNLAE